MSGEDVQPGIDARTGKFLPGNKLSRGNYKGTPHKLLNKELAEHLGEAKRLALYDKAYERAMKGSDRMIQLLVEQIHGKAASAVQVTGLDGEPLGINLKAITTTILTAIGSDHEARFRVAAALSRIGAQPAALDGPEAGKDEQG
jgi:hypothetical protein